MKISLDALLVLDAIARKGSFAGAAQEMHRVPSAITYTVQKLEQDLGVQLFDRSRQRANLTPAGEALLRDGRFLLRTADEVESRVKRVASGWESELRIAVDDIIPVERLFPLLRGFYREGAGTRLRLSSEILNGCWDALLGGRADLIVGAPGDAPPEGSFSVEPMGEVEFVFVVAPGHPLAVAAEPLSAEDVLQHRAVPAADTSRSLPPRSAGLIEGQDTLTLPGLRAKLAAHIAGLGVGYLPLKWAEPHISAGRLIAKSVEGSKPRVNIHCAWRPRNAGKALKWFIAKLRDERVKAYLRGDAGRYPDAE